MNNAWKRIMLMKLLLLSVTIAIFKFMVNVNWFGIYQNFLAYKAFVFELDMATEATVH